MHAQPGDEIVVDSRGVGAPPRRGEILEVSVTNSGEHYTVRWDDGHESVFYPGTDAHVVHTRHLG